MTSSEEGKKVTWVRINCIVPADLYLVWEEVVGRLEKEGVTHPVEIVRNGIVLEILAAEFLSGN